MKLDFVGSTAVIVCHDSVFGPPHELRDYFLAHSVHRLLFIGHQNRYLHNNTVRSSYFELYEDGGLILKFSDRQRNLPEPVAYAHDFLLTVLWSFRFMGSIDYFIGLGNLNAFAGLFVGMVKRVTSTIYYVIDYSPTRFQNTVLNTIYHYIDYVCARWCTQTWNYAQGMISERTKKWKRKFPNQIIVPNGITIKAGLPGPSKRQSNELSYIGTLTRQQGVLFIIDAMKILVTKIPDIHLTIVGMGDDRGNIERRVREYKIQKNVTLKGFVPDPFQADTIISKSNLGLAMYEPGHGFIMYTEPGKIKRYLSCSVPVIMTDVSPLAADIVRYKCGFCSPYDTHAFVRIVSGYLNDPSKIAAYKKNALRYAQRYTWEKIFTASFKLLHNRI